MYVIYRGLRQRNLDQEISRRESLEYLLDRHGDTFESDGLEARSSSFQTRPELHLNTDKLNLQPKEVSRTNPAFNLALSHSHTSGASHVPHDSHWHPSTVHIQSLPSPPPSRPPRRPLPDGYLGDVSGSESESHDKQSHPPPSRPPRAPSLADDHQYHADVSGSESNASKSSKSASVSAPVSKSSKSASVSGSSKSASVPSDHSSHHSDHLLDR